MVLIDMEMPNRCGDCPLHSVNSIGNGMYYDYCRLLQKRIYDTDCRMDDCLLKECEQHKPQVSVNIYDQEEIHHNCTVQVLTNSVTGEVSVGWWKEDADEI